MDRVSLGRRVPAVSVFAVTLAVRLLALWRLLHSPYGAPVTGDMKFYADWAWRIASGQWTDFHAFYGEPLYAYLVAGIFALGGQITFWIGLLQAIADAGTAVAMRHLVVGVWREIKKSGRLVAADDFGPWRDAIKALDRR